MSTSSVLPTTVDAVIGRLADAGYLADRRLGTTVFLALTLRRPLFLEGEPGVGKTELAKALADRARGRRCCGCSATRASTSPRLPTNGTWPGR